MKHGSIKWIHIAILMLLSVQSLFSAYIKGKETEKQMQVAKEQHELLRQEKELKQQLQAKLDSCSLAE